jgi:1-pyrroline-5-carboxylate dehydrogenase
MATVEAPTRPQTRLHEGPFVNEPLTDFTKEPIARQMRAAIEKVRGQLGREYDLIIGGKRTRTSDKIKSINPAKPSQLVGLHQKAGKEHVEPAMQAALAAFAVLAWRATPGAPISSVVGTSGKAGQRSLAITAEGSTMFDSR